MTEQEQQMLQDLSSRVNSTTLTDKDPEAEHFLQQSLGRNPDALYILAQTVLVQQYGLDQAKKQLDDLRNQPPPAPVKHTSFLGSLLGSHDDQPAPPPPPPYTQQQYAPIPNSQPQYAQPQYSQPQYAPQYANQPYGQPQQGGFLRGAMQTATGVAAGALAFEGIESLFHGFGGGGGNRGNFGEFGGGGGGGREEIVNNYYGDSDREGLSRDVEDRRDDSGDSRNFADSSDPGTDDFADQSYDSGDDNSAADSGDFSSDDNNS